MICFDKYSMIWSHDMVVYYMKDKKIVFMMVIAAMVVVFGAYYTSQKAAVVKEGATFDVIATNADGSKKYKDHHNAKIMVTCPKNQSPYYGSFNLPPKCH